MPLLFLHYFLSFLPFCGCYFLAFCIWTGIFVTLALTDSFRHFVGGTDSVQTKGCACLYVDSVCLFPFYFLLLPLPSLLNTMSLISLGKHEYSPIFLSQTYSTGRHIKDIQRICLCYICGSSICFFGSCFGRHGYVRVDFHVFVCMKHLAALHGTWFGLTSLHTPFVRQHF